MNLQVVLDVLESPSAEAISALLEDQETVFWVDWRECDDDIPKYCEEILKTGCLSGELVESVDDDFQVHILYRDMRVKVPLTHSGGDRHFTIWMLNEVLKPDYEIRFCIDSNGNDSAAFLPLPATQWAELEKKYGDRVSKHFYRIRREPNLFTDRMTF